MKAILKLLIIGLVSGVGGTALSARADLEVATGVVVHATSDFYAPLASMGSWFYVRPYRRCWRPAEVAVQWRPYCHGHWVWTDCGWYWASDEPWAWACYHYGRWLYDRVHAWIWVPGTEWAPAWVTWRVGAGEIGWAPLPPAGATVSGSAFAFVPTAQFRRRIRPWTVIKSTPALLVETTAINNIKRETRNVGGSGPQEVMVNPGPGLAEVQRASRTTIKALSIRDAAGLTPAPAELPRPRSEPKGKDQTSLAPVEPPKPAAEPRPLPGGDNGHQLEDVHHESD